MSKKKNQYLVLDIESVQESAPHYYAWNIAYSMCNRQGEISFSKDFIISEAVGYLRKIPKRADIYKERIQTGLTKIVTWQQFLTEFSKDANIADFICTYAGQGDLNSFLPYSDAFFRHMYADGFHVWKNKPFSFPKNGESFSFKNVDLPIIDIWGEVVDKLIQTNKYKNYCLKNNLLSKDGRTFKTTMPIIYQYVFGENDIINHIAANDVYCEIQLLTKCLQRGAPKIGVRHFPCKNFESVKSFTEKG